MDCSELLRTLDPYLDAELAPPEREQVEAHLRACPACRASTVREGHARIALRAQLRSALAPGTPAGSAPAALRERIHVAIAAEGVPAPRRRVTPLRIAALAACGVGLLVAWGFAGRTADPLVEEVARKHARDLPLEVSATPAGPEAVAGWFHGKLDFNPSPPRFQAPVRIVGARLAELHERPAAYVRYEDPRGRFGLFIVDDPERRLEHDGRVVKAGRTRVRLASARGFNVAVWRRNEIVYSLVSDLDEGDVTRLAEAAQAARR